MKRCISALLLVLTASLCAIDFGLLASLACAPLSFKQALRFRQCSLASVGFCYSLGEHHNEEKIHDD
jgi:hypothetical protein